MPSPTRSRWALLLLAVEALLAACAEPVDRAAKSRIFSPEDPPAAIASAAQPLPVERLASEPELARRVLEMGAAEATERLGSHRFRAEVRFQWRGPQEVTLSESRTLTAGRGGVAGDFHALTENSREQGREVIRIGGRVFARNRFGPFRERKRDRGMAERTREETYAVLKDFSELFRDRLSLTPRGTTRHAGREVQRFTVALAAPPEEEEASIALPPRPQPRAAVDESTHRRLTFFARRVPKSVSGEVWVDAERSVVVKADLKGVLDILAAKGVGKPAVLDVVVATNTSGVGVDAPLKPPDTFLPDEDKPAGIAAALQRFGFSGKKAADGGVTPSDEPTDEEP